MPRRYLLLLPALLLLLPSVRAQSATFNVVVESKSASHPNAGQGHPDAYVIDGEEANTLTLIRGNTYVFEVTAGADNHPFYISTSDVGGGAGAYSDGVTGNGATTGQTLTFEVPEDAPDLLYYQCQFHQFMGWEINVINNPVANEGEAQPLALSLSAAFPNPFDQAAQVSVTLAEARTATVAVFDVAGRHVRTIYDGLLAAGTTPFRVSGAGLAPGTYLVRVTADGAVREQRVTLVR